MIVNINYKGKVSQEITNRLNFPIGKPAQFIDKSGKYTIIIFKSGSCRIMGCKKPIEMDSLQYDIKNIRLQSLSIVVNLGTVINLYKLSRITKCWFEPELFPALRLTKYDPICVNVFSTGKVVILGLKNLYYQGYVDGIISDLYNLIEKYDSV